jgi:hypothetical protein
MLKRWRHRERFPGMLHEAASDEIEDSIRGRLLRLCAGRADCCDTRAGRGGGAGPANGPVPNVQAASDYLAMLGATHLRRSADADHFASLARQQDAVSVELRELVLRDRKLRAPIPTAGRTWPMRALSKGTLFRLPWRSSPGRG